LLLFGFSPGNRSDQNGSSLNTEDTDNPGQLWKIGCFIVWPILLSAFMQWSLIFGFGVLLDDFACECIVREDFYSLPAQM